MREVKKLMHHAYTPGEGVKLLARAIEDCNRKRRHYGCNEPLTYCIEYVPGTQSSSPKST